MSGLDARNVVDSTAVQHTQAVTIAVERHRLRELSFVGNRVSNLLDVLGVLGVDGEQRERV